MSTPSTSSYDPLLSGDLGSGKAPRQPRTASPLFAAAVLCSMNLLNYVDRYVFSALGKQIQDDLAVNDFYFGLLTAAFIVVYTFASPLFGWMGDRFNRLRLISAGVAVWSVATVGTATAFGFSDMFFWRAVLGIGEASYGVIAPALLSDLFSPRFRGRVIGIYYLALPVGGALGFLLGTATLSFFDSWRLAFWVVGLPGLFAALAGLLIRDPGRGASERAAAKDLDFDPNASEPTPGSEAKAKGPTLESYLQFFRIPSFLFNTAGLAMVTFTTGAFAAWGAIYYQRVRGEDEQILTIIGIMLAVSGLLGIVLGTTMADQLLKLTRRAYLIWASIAVFGSVPLGLIALLVPNTPLSLGLLFVAMLLLASTLGPCNTVTANVVPASKRAAGFAVSIFLVHLLGDIPSPILVGYISDLFGTEAIINSPIGQFVETLGAPPNTYVPEESEDLVEVTNNLTVGMLSIVPVLILGGVFYILGSRTLPQDQDNAIGSHHAPK